ncbi:MAG: hypothetical protein E7265_07155 [Lachnospiraceae bacterium]|nr:hypothetical protein [Lachnospiraceae bacterium]
MAIRLSGLASGMDTEAIVKQLMEAHSMKKTKVVNNKTKLEWKQEKWKDLNTKLYALYTDKVSNLRFSSSYNVKKTSVSDSSIAGIKAKSSSANGNYTMKVNHIATANYVTSGKLKLAAGTDGEKVSGTTKISDLAGGQSLVGQEVEVSYGGKTHVLAIDEDTTVADYVGAFKAVGLSASFDEGQQRIFTSSSKTGAQSNFSVTVSSSNQLAARDALRDVVAADYDSLSDEDKEKIDALIQDVKSNQVGSDKYNNALAELQTFASAVGSANNEQVEAAVAAYKNESAGNGLVALGMANIVNGKAVGTAPSDLAVIEGTDSEIILNGATLTSSDTVVNANGLEIELKGVTGTNPITFSVSSDVDAVYDKIKEFISEYNSILGEMNTLYRAASSRGYEPLTDEEKEAMSEDQIELWENKIKDSLLRNDGTLNGVITSIKGAMMSSVEVDGKSYSLSSLGIMTSTDYKENGLLHIFGDADDATYSDKPDKLRAMLESDPELVTNIMTGIAGKLYEEMGKKMGSSSLSSALTFYNDKQITKQLKSYESDISDWESRLEKIENRYYDQFAAMEKAMTKLNSSQTYLSQLMG